METILPPPPFGIIIIIKRPRRKVLQPTSTSETKNNTHAVDDDDQSVAFFRFLYPISEMRFLQQNEKLTHINTKTKYDQERQRASQPALEINDKFNVQMIIIN